MQQLRYSFVLSIVLLLCQTAAAQFLAPYAACDHLLKPAPAPEDLVQIDSFPDSLPPVDTVPVPQPKFKDTISLMAVGDMMIGTSFPDVKYLPPEDGAWILQPLHDLFGKADLVFGNLEGSFLDEGPVVKRCKDTTKCYAFRMPEKYAEHFATAGFDMLSLANNHLGDFGDAGRFTTINLLDSLGILHAGQLVRPYTSFEYEGLTIGFIAFSPNTGTLDIVDVPNAVRLVDSLDSFCDIVIVSFHGGAEGADHQHVTRETETYYGENRGNVYEFSHGLIDAGADMVLGHGPHIVRAVELYKDRIIAYSLGNFATYARFSLTPPKNLSPVLEVQFNRDGSFARGMVHSYIQSGEGGPKQDINERAYQKIKTLTQEDFPETNLQFPGNGLILKKP